MLDLMFIIVLACLFTIHLLNLNIPDWFLLSRYLATIVIGGMEGTSAC